MARRTWLLLAAAALPAAARQRTVRGATANPDEEEDDAAAATANPDDDDAWVDEGRIQEHTWKGQPVANMTWSEWTRILFTEEGSKCLLSGGGVVPFFNSCVDCPLAGALQCVRDMRTNASHNVHRPSGNRNSKRRSPFSIVRQALAAASSRHRRGGVAAASRRRRRRGGVVAASRRRRRRGSGGGVEMLASECWHRPFEGHRAWTI